jgi:hypothetical protein
MTAGVESPKDLLNVPQPKTVETTKNKFEYLCLNATKAYFKEVVSENQTYIRVIAKIALLAFPLIAAFAILEAAFDLLMAPLIFIANRIAGPQEIPQETAPPNLENSNAADVPPIAPLASEITKSVDDIGLGRTPPQKPTIQRTSSFDQLPFAVTFQIPKGEAKKPDVFIPMTETTKVLNPVPVPVAEIEIAPNAIDSAPTTPTTDPLPAEPVLTAETEILPTTPTKNPLPATLTPPQKVTPLYFNRNFAQRTRVRNSLLPEVPLPPPTPPSPAPTVTSNNSSSKLSRKAPTPPADTKQSASLTKRALTFLSRRNSTD